ncbi:phosphoribosylaminoimidazolesuccinocarboxamide synthase [Amphibacillus sp. MSJ-3]|uniref:phosphoribosylaminoimidazolesuccinocarboxamide synthase n=1 Tax=Amphibacillus sp. MSJ-3 TaxID=2841505 RepID=UPI001C0EFD2C|nr:phosphoribosylaminoimidazolesuccinocarboxamide synthase [Amphibacillus sp. MSJ-3]
MKKELLYEGKAKRVYLTDQPNQLILAYKNEATAFNGKKKAKILGKGRFNNLISAYLFQYLAEHKVSSHFIKQLNEEEQLVERTEIIPLEVVVRNLATGSIVQRLGLKEKTVFQPALVELYFKDDSLDDPIINDQHALLLTDLTEEELDLIKGTALSINQILQPLFEKAAVRLVDFKLEFGRNQDGDIILADEISPDTCRFWDMATNERLDKDVFRQDTGDLLTVYQEILNRLEAIK